MLFFAVPLCEDTQMTQPVDGTIRSVTLYKYGCTDGSCGSPQGTYIIQAGNTTHIAVVNDRALGIRFTGTSVCFSWEQDMVTYYSFGDPEYDNSCHMECVPAASMQFEMVYYISRNYAYGSQVTTSSYIFTNANSPPGQATGPGSTDPAQNSATGLVYHSVVQLIMIACVATVSILMV
jgi:hypothetical protein